MAHFFKKKQGQNIKHWTHICAATKIILDNTHFIPKGEEYHVIWLTSCFTGSDLSKHVNMLIISM